MTPLTGIPMEPRAFAIHERVCGRCGHGTGVHRMIGPCVACEQRRDAGVRSADCAQFTLTTTPRRIPPQPARDLR
jgi:hypothetical protein